MINILYISIGPNSGGPIKSLIQIINKLDTNKFKAFVLSLPNPHVHTLADINAIDRVVVLKTNLWINNWLSATNKDFKFGIWHKLKLPGRILRSFYNGYLISKLIKYNNIDIVHTNIELTIDGAIGAFISHKPHIWHLRATIGRLGTVQHFLGQRFCCRVISMLSTKIIVNSIATLGSVKKYIKSEKIILIHNGIDTDKLPIKKTKHSLRYILNIESTTKVIASIGYFSKTKGGDIFIEVAIKTLKAFNDVVFVWIGPSFERKGDSFCMSVFKFLLDNHLENKILFTGERNDIEDLLNDVDIFLNPMKNGSWSRVVLEAMAASLPVVAIEELKISEVIENGLQGILVRDKEEAINEISHLLMDECYCKYIGLNAHDHVIHNFTDTNTASQIMSIYESI